MQHARPRRISRRRVERLLSKSKPSRSAGSRIEILSRQFLGQPYLVNPLIGSADKPEVFTVSLDAFDCVTFVETILALSLPSNADEFLAWLQKIRYEDGRVDWERRNHYMTGWIRSNLKAGSLRRSHCLKFRWQQSTACWMPFPVRRPLDRASRVCPNRRLENWPPTCTMAT